MTLDEAIQHCKEVAKESKAAALTYARENAYETAISCKACGQEHEQLAEWLTELKQRREAEITAPPKQKPSVQQSLDAWALLNELIKLGYPHNFQHEAPHISGYLYDISALIDKAYEIKATEQASLLDRLAAEYDRKHPNGLKFVYSLDGETKQTEQGENG